MNKSLVLSLIAFVLTISFFPVSQGPAQNAVPYKVTTQLKNSSGLFVELQYTGSDTFYVKDTSPIPTKLFVRVLENTDSELSVVITDGNSFAVPEQNSQFPFDKLGPNTYTQIHKITRGSRKYKYSVLPDVDTILRVERILSDGTTETVFDSKGSDFLYSALYSTIGTTLPNNQLYGFGERRKKFRYDQDGKYSTYPKDQFGQVDSGKPNGQTYGYHPMWLQRSNSGNFHVGFLKSTSPLQTEITAGKKFQLHIVGGQIFLKFFIGDTDPEQPVKAYHQYINGYTIHPFWTQGYHHSRWGYKSSKEMLEKRNKFQELGFPLDVMWNDLDYMVDYKDFTLQKNFTSEEYNQLTDISQKTGVYWVPLIDMGVAVGTEAAANGTKLGIFLRSTVYNDQMIGCVWPGPVLFPDFNHPASFNYWNESLFAMYTVLNTTPMGYWIDMNENSNFIPGELGPGETCPPAENKLTTKPSVDDRNFIPFNILGDDVPLAVKSMTPITVHYNKSDALLIPEKNNTELFFHPVNSYGEAYITYKSLQDSTKSPLVFSLSRASMYGTGRYAAHWTGDNLADWDFYQFAVSELLPFQLFGIPFVGHDLCGFAGNTTAELCTRWMQMGAWIPFSRNHNSNVSIDQEPFALQEDYVLPATRSAFLQRYSYLKWLYSLFVRNWDRFSEHAAGTVMKPIWWLFPDDLAAWDNEDTQFMMGTEIMIAPVLKKGDSVTQTTPVDVYFPGKGKWFDKNGTTYQGGTKKTFTVGFTQDIPFFFREGSIVHKQTPQLRARFLDNVFDLQVALSQNGTSYKAKGNILSISNYDGNNVHEKCLSNYRDCVAELIVSATLTGNKLTGSLTYHLSTYLTQSETISFRSLSLFGVKDGVAIQVPIQLEASNTQTINFSVSV